MPGATDKKYAEMVSKHINLYYILTLNLIQMIF